MPGLVGGYVLAGGRSSRMGTDKALLQLADKPLIALAGEKLRRVAADVHILSANATLARYAPLFADLHPGCGPIGGIEAALTHSPHPWNIFLAVDMPLLPAAFITGWTNSWLQDHDDPARIRIFTQNGIPQPGFCLVHQDVLPYLSQSIRAADYKLMRAFELAGSELAKQRRLPQQDVLWCRDAELPPQSSPAMPDAVTQAQLAARQLWFANLNTPEDLAHAEAHLDALDP